MANQRPDFFDQQPVDAVADRAVVDWCKSCARHPTRDGCRDDGGLTNDAEFCEGGVGGDPPTLWLASRTIAPDCEACANQHSDLRVVPCEPCLRGHESTGEFAEFTLKLDDGGPAFPQVAGQSGPGMSLYAHLVGRVLSSVSAVSADRQYADGGVAFACNTAEHAIAEMRKRGVRL